MASLIAVHFLDLLNWNIVEILHYFLVSINDLIPIFGSRSVLSRSCLLLMFTWLSRLQSEFTGEVLL